MNGKCNDYYIYFSQFYYPESIGQKVKLEMKSGKFGIYEVISVKAINDWRSKDICIDFIGYENIKPIRKCTFEEYLELYEDN